jgi:hypothetical protein
VNRDGFGGTGGGQTWSEITNFVADPSDYEKYLPKQGSIGNARPIIGLSRRTKVSSPNASRSSYLKAKGTLRHHRL